ncbi:MAG: dimethyl sulfoxide reductase anchor subunit family protein [Enterobacteriaceae bacterium]
MHELPLVFFTVAGQSSVGVFLLAWLSRALGLMEKQQLQRANCLAFVLLIIGLAIGGLHIGQPLRALNMLLGVGRSPMSTEIVLCALYVTFASGTLFFSHLWRQNILAGLCNMLTLVAGLAFVWSIPQVYQLATVPAWNSSYTTVQMWMTLLVCGGALSLCVGARLLGSGALLTGVLLQMFCHSGYLNFLSQSVPDLAAQQIGYWAAQLLLLTLAVIITVISWLRPRLSPLWLGFSALGVLLAELAGRIAFYNLWMMAL